MMVTELSADEFESKTAKGDCIVDFYAVWCGPCQMLKPVYEKLSSEFNNLNFFKLDIDNAEQITNDFGVRTVPTIVFMKDGKEIDRTTGVVMEAVLRQRIKDVFKL